MKKFLLILLALGCLSLTACRKSSSIGVIGGADGPTSIFITSEAK